MKLKDFINTLQQLHDGCGCSTRSREDASITFWFHPLNPDDDAILCEIKPDSKDDKFDTGIEVSTNMGCGCWIGVDINIQPKPKSKKCPQCDHWFYPDEKHDEENCSSLGDT